MSERGIRAHSVEVARIEMESHDGESRTNIMEQAVQVVMEMGIYTKTIYGSIQMYDGVGLHGSVPIIGEEKITFVFNSSGREERQVEVYVTRVYDFEFTDDYTAASYKIDFIGKEGFLNFIKRGDIDYYVNSDNPLKLIEDITDNYLETDKFVTTGDEEYTGDVEIVFPKVSPFKAIDMIRARTYNKDTTQSSAFMFFEDLNGFRFMTIDSMFKQPAVEYVFETSESQSGGTNTNRIYELYRIISFEMRDKANTPNKFKNGMIDSELFRFSLVDKKLRSTKQQFSKFASQLPGLDNNFRISNTTDFVNEYQKDIENLSKYNGAMHNVSYGVNQNFVSFDTKAATFSKTLAMIESLKQIQFDIVVPGNTDMMPGMLVDIKTWPRAVTYNTRDRYDKYLKGKSVVVGVKHMFNKGEITTILTCAKPSPAEKFVPIDIVPR